VLREDYNADNFVDGPLLEAMREGGFLYIEELNRAPEDTLNTLLTAMAEREVAVPRVGRVAARPTFRVIATMNPFDNVGTTRLSTSILDRFGRLAVTYQDEESERGIVALRAPLPPDEVPVELHDTLVADAVAVTRATRDYPDVRQGSSVRGAIDLTLIAGELLALRGIRGSGGNDRLRTDDPARQAYADTVFDAMVVALSGRIQLDATSGRINGYLPNIDVTMETAASYAGAMTIGVVLTGMGNDGAAGAKAIQNAGGLVIAQDETTSVIFGMPAEAIKAANVEQILPLDDIYAAIEKRVIQICRATPVGAK